MAQQPGARALLHDYAAVEHDHPVAEAAGHRQVVGDKQQAQAQTLLQIPQQGQHVGLHFGVQHADALVAEQHFWLQYQGPGDCHPLLLAARELAGQAVFEGFSWGQPHGREEFPGPAAGLVTAGQAVDQQGIGDGFADNHLGVEAG